MIVRSSRAEPLCLPLDAWAALCEAVPNARDLDAAMRIIENVRSDRLGDGLLTVNVRIDDDLTSETMALQRVWTSNPAAYPVAGRKRKARTDWARQLLDRAEVFVGEGSTALAEVFDDHERIASLGLRSIVNVPLLDRDRACFATFNVLTPRERWQRHELLLIRLLALVATPAVAREASGPA